MRDRGRLVRWIVVLAVMAAATLVLGRLLGGGEASDPGGARVASYVAGPDELAAALEVPGAVFRPSNPPVDVDEVVRSARSITMDSVPLPDDREVSAYRRLDTGAELTQIVLLYDDPGEAAMLEKLAPSLVAGSFHLETEPTTLEGAESARLWSSNAYRAISFRVAGVVVFIGSTDIGSDAELRRVAESTAARIAAEPPATATAPGSAPRAAP